MTLRETIHNDMKTALKERQTTRLATIRLLLAAMKQVEVDERIVLDDAAVIAIVQKLCKQRRDSIEQFTAGGRHDLADKERDELAILTGYLPQSLSADEISARIAAAIAACGAKSIADMSRVMAQLKPELAGRADMAEVSKAVRAALAPA